jgi:uncharacterized protein (TIGR02466 family)
MPDFSKARYTHIYPTPLLTYVLKDGLEFNVSLRKQILAHRAKTSGVSKSNHGGWHSETGQLEFCGGAGQRLVRHMYEMADEATKRVLAEFGEEFQPVKWHLEAWANVNASGDFNKMHVHPASTWSGTYYVDPGEPADAKGGTPLHLFDPCSGRSTFLPSLPATIYIYPKPALMVLFPSYVPHMVFPHDGASERISIAFNLRKEPFP